MLRRGSFLAVVLALCGTAPTAHAESPSCQAVGVEPYPLCGETVVSGEGGSVVQVRTEEDSVLDMRDAGFIDRFVRADLEGPGPLLGFVISTDLEPSDGGLYLQALRLAEGYHSILQDLVSTNLVEVEQERYLLPAGTYSLYLVGQAEVRATVPLLDREGRLEVEAFRSVASAVVAPPNYLDPAGTGYHAPYSAGIGHDFNSAGVIALSVDTRTTVIEPADDWWLCWYYGNPENPAVAYMPGCPAQVTEDTDAFALHAGPWVPGGGQLLAGFFGSEPRAIGYWRMGASPLTRMASVGYWLEFDGGQEGSWMPAR